MRKKLSLEQEQELCQKYSQRQRVNILAKEYGISRHTVWKTLRNNISTAENRGQFEKGFIPWMKGKHHSEESNKKNKDAHIGKSAWNKGIKLDRSKVPTMGHFQKHTEEAKIKIGNIHRGNKYCLGRKVLEETKTKLSLINKGERHPNWQGGISREPYPFEFDETLKEKIRKRDNYTCQNKECNMTEEEHLIVYGRCLLVHHIDYDKENCKENNLVSTCIQCNFRANFNREYWKEYFSKLTEVYYA